MNSNKLSPNILKPRILHLIGNFDQGGSESQAIQLVRMLQQTGRYELYVACLEPSGVLRPSLESFFTRDIPEFPLTSFYDRNALRQLHNFRKFLQRNKIQIVQTHDFYSNVFGMTGAALAGVAGRIAARREIGGIRTPAQRMVERLAYRLGHKCVANAAAVRERLISEGVRAEKIVVVYNGLDLNRFPDETSLRREQILKQLHLPVNGHSFVTIIANMRFAVKDHPTFLKAAQLVHEKMPTVAFVIAGEGKLRKQLETLCAELGLATSTFFIGRCDRVPELLSISDVCVLSSKSEGMPNVVLEYMAASRPVVATNVGGIGELLVDGEGGFLVAAEDYESLAARILFLLDNPEKARMMGRRNRHITEQRFSAEAQAKRTEELYEEILMRTGSLVSKNSQTGGD